MKKTGVRLAVIFFLTVIFLYFFLRSVSWKEVLGYLTHINLFLFILLIIVTPVHLATRAFRWKYLLMHEKKNVRFFNMFAGNAVGFTVTLIFPGRLGELVKPLYLAKKEEMPKGFVLGTVVVERIFDIFTMCFLLGAFLLARPLYSSSNNLNSEAYTNLTLWGIIGVSFASCLLVFILIFYFFREKTLAVVAFLARPFPHKISQGVQELAREFILGLKFFHSLGNLTLYILFSFVVWLGIVAYYWLFFFSYRYSLSFFLVFPFVFLTMVGASIPTPGMVGGFDYFSKLGMTSLFGISASRAVGMTIVIHAIQVVVTCLIGYVILWKDGLSVFKLKKLREAVEK